MTATSTTQRRDRRRARRTFWIGLSFLLSGSILVWSFTAPFRQATPLVSVDDRQQLDGQSTTADAADRRRTQAEEFREAAIALDREFMRTVRERRKQPDNLPGLEKSRQAWQLRSESFRRQIAELADAKEGTLEWQYRHDLQQSLADGPR